MRNRMHFFFISGVAFLLFLGLGIFLGSTGLNAEMGVPADEALSGADLEAQELMKAKEALRSGGGYDTRRGSSTGSPVSNKSFSRAESFLAGPDWEFDGFVAGGQDERIKSMFIINDLVYLNIGYVHGIDSGDRLSIYRRGDKIRDPQSGRFLGFEVRRAAVSEVTDKVDEETCVARIIRTYEGVEIGDLVKRGD